MSGMTGAADFPLALSRFDDVFINMQEIPRAFAEFVANEIMPVKVEELVSWPLGSSGCRVCGWM